MPLPLRMVLVIAVTLVAVLGSTRLVRRLGGSAAASSVAGHLAQTVLRLFLTVGIALVVGLKSEEHKAVLVFAVGATYFAAVVWTAWRESRRKVNQGTVNQVTQVQAAEGAR